MTVDTNAASGIAHGSFRSGENRTAGTLRTKRNCASGTDHGRWGCRKSSMVLIGAIEYKRSICSINYGKYNGASFVELIKYRL